METETHYRSENNLKRGNEDVIGLEKETNKSTKRVKLSDRGNSSSVSGF